MNVPLSFRQARQSYEALVGPQLLEQAGPLISQKLKGPECAIVTDDNVAALFAERVSRSLTDAGFRPTLDHGSPGRRIENAGAGRSDLRSDERGGP